MTNGEKYKTAQERAEEFYRFCDNVLICDDCPLKCLHESNMNACRFAWLDLEVEENKPPLPCPFCGAPVEFDDNCNVFNCTSCNYMSSGPLMNESSIAAHNRVAKKCDCSSLMSKVDHAVSQFERKHDTYKDELSIVTETDNDEDSLVIRIFGGKK